MIKRVVSLLDTNRLYHNYYEVVVGETEADKGEMLNHGKTKQNGLNHVVLSGLILKPQACNYSSNSLGINSLDTYYPTYLSEIEIMKQ